MADPDTLVAKMASLAIDEETKLEIAEAFIACDSNNSGFIENSELQTALNKANIKKVSYQMQDVYKKYDLNQDGRLDLLEFAEVINKEKSLKLRHIKGKKIDINQEVTVIQTKSGGHIQVGKGEPRAFSAYLNQAFADDSDCQALGLNKIDLGNADDLYDKVQNGVIFCKLVNLVEPDTIPTKSIALKKLDQVYRRNENLRLGINSAASIGCQCIGTTPITIRDKHINIILGLLWQLIKKHSFLNLNLKDNKNLANLLLPGETLEDLMNLSPEEILLRWVNYHLDKDDNYSGPKINNFGKDIKDGQAYVSLLNRVQPRGEDALCPPLNYDAQNYNDQDRARAIQQMATRLDCGDYITPDDILEGNDRVNTLFVSHLFNTHPALEEWKDDLDLDLDETREEKTFKNWINSMDIFDPSKDKLGERLRQLNYLYPPLAGAVVILKLEDCIKEGSVDWKRVNKTATYKRPGGIQRKLENCGYALDVARDLKCKIIGIGGENIAESHKMYTLAVIWQLMRKYTLKFGGLIFLEYFRV